MRAKYLKLTTVRRINDYGFPADEFCIKIAKGKAKLISSKPISRAPPDHKLEKISEEEVPKTLRHF